MSINGIHPSIGGTGYPTGPIRPERGDEVSNGRAARPESTATVQGAAHALQATGLGSGIEPPQGTDPALWSVLTAEERSFFARARAMGPLSYGRGSDQSAMPGVRLGGRIDVKV